MIALEIIHFYLNVLISKSVTILSRSYFPLPSPILSFPYFFSFEQGPLPCMHGGWSLWATSELFSKTTRTQPTPLPACGSSFLISLISVVSSAHPKPPHPTASRVHILYVAFVPTCWKHRHRRRELWSMERPWNLYVWFRGGKQTLPNACLTYSACSAATSWQVNLFGSCEQSPGDPQNCRLYRASHLCF